MTTGKVYYVKEGLLAHEFVHQSDYQDVVDAAVAEVYAAIGSDLKITKSSLYKTAEEAEGYFQRNVIETLLVAILEKANNLWNNKTGGKDTLKLNNYERDTQKNRRVTNKYQDYLDKLHAPSKIECGIKYEVQIP